MRRKKCDFKYDCKNWCTNNRFLLLNTSPEAIPCAICLQVMAEFFDQDTKIIITESKSFNENKMPTKIYTLKDLLKVPFDRKELHRVTQ